MKNDRQYDRKYYVENIVKAKRYLIASIVLAIAGGVYELFSHGVYSYYMIYAFMIPLLLGCLPYLADTRGFFKRAGSAVEELLLASIATMTIGSVIKGVLEIYGTTNTLTAVYPILGAVILAAVATKMISSYKKQRDA